MAENRRDGATGGRGGARPPGSDWQAFHDARARFLAGLAADAEIFRLERAFAAPSRTGHETRRPDARAGEGGAGA